MDEKNPKKEGKISKLMLGIIVGGAVGSVVGATLSDKERREKIKEKSVEVFGKTKEYLAEKIPQKKKGFWHILHDIFHGKK